MSEDIDELLDQLKNNDSLTTMVEQHSAKKLDLKDDNINDFILQNAGKLVADGVDTIEALKQTVISGFDSDELVAYSDLIKSTVSAIDTLNKINLQNKKVVAAKEIKAMDIAAKKELPPAQVGGNTNILIATREEIIKNFLDKAKEPINITPDEDDEDKHEQLPS